MTSPPPVPAPRVPASAARGGRVDTGGGDTGATADTGAAVDRGDLVDTGDGRHARGFDDAGGYDDRREFDDAGDFDDAGGSDSAGDFDDAGDLADDRLSGAHVAIRQRRYRAARDMLLAILLDHPDSVAALTLLATVSTLLGDAGGTLQFADAALRIAPGQPDLLAKRATALSALGRRDEARRAADAAIAYEPRSAEAYAARAGVDLADHSPTGYAAVLDVMARARHAVPSTSPYILTLTARYACALDGLGARAHARTVLADLIRAYPDSPTVRYQAAELESSAWRWRRTIGHLARLLSSPDGALRVTARRRCATAIRLWLVELAGFGALLALVGVAARTWWPGGAIIAVAAVVAYAVIIGASVFSLARGRGVIAQIIGRSPGAIAAVVVIAAMLTGQIIAVVRVSDLTRGTLTWLLAVAVILGFGAATDFMVRLSGVIGHRYKAFVHRERIAAARALESTRPTIPACIFYPVDVPTPGRLSLSGFPAEPTAPSATAVALDDFGPYGVDVVVSTVRTDGPRRDGGATAVERIVFPVEAGKPPREQGFDALVATVIDRLRAGSSVVIVCRTGAERSAVVAAAVCVRLGLAPDIAWSHVERSRGVPLAVSPAQRAWLDRFAGHDRDRQRDDQRAAARNGFEVRADQRLAALPTAG